MPDEPTGGPTPQGTPIGKPSAIGEPPCSLISSRARPYNSSCFLPSHLHHQNNLLIIKYLQVKAKRHSPFTCLHQHPTSVKAVKAKNTPYCVVYTRARTNKKRQYAPTCPTRFRKPAFSTSQLNPTTSEVEKTISEVAAPPSPKC